jgi:hypothetical protein
MYVTNLVPANPYNKKCERRLEARKLVYTNTDKKYLCKFLSNSLNKDYYSSLTKLKPSMIFGFKFQLIPRVEGF